MKFQRLLTIAVFILLAALLCTTVYSQDDEEIIRMDNSAFETPQRPGAVFDHDTHNEIAELEDDCSVCHHVYEDGKIVEDESSEDTPCGDCHGLKKSPDNSTPLRKAFHKRCRDCHFESKKGPVLCGECHIKEGR